MKTILSLFLFGAVVSAAPVNVSFVDVGSPAAAYGFYVGPYTLSINGVNTPAMCVDDFLEVYYGDKWSASLTAVNSPDLSDTYLGNGGKIILGNTYSSSQIYRAEAYLFSLITKPGADRGNIQEAAWAIMDSNTLANVFNSNNTAVEQYLQDAYNNSPSFDSASFGIVSETGIHSKQEFIVANAPEPATFALFGAGLVLAGTARFLRRRMQVNA